MPDDVVGLQAQVERGRRQLQLRQAFAQQHQQVRRLTRGFGQRYVQRGDCGRMRVGAAVALVFHHEAETAHEGVLRGEPGHQPREQHTGAMQQLLGGVGAGEEFEPAVERW
jgi:hypothetical protein